MSKEREIEKIYSLTPMQEGMLFHFIKDKGSAAYFDQYLITLRGQIDKAHLEKSLNIIIKRHDVLRTLFVYEKIQKPKQVVLKDVNLKIDFTDISHLSEKEEHIYLEDFKKQDREKGFNLTKDIPMRVFLFKSGTGFYRLLWSFHHITMPFINMGQEQARPLYASAKVSYMSSRSLAVDATSPIDGGKIGPISALPAVAVPCG